MDNKDDDRPDGSTAGLAGRVDAAPGRRGFTTRGLRVRLAVVLLAFSLVPVGAVGFGLYRLTNLGGPDNVCNGAATAEQVHDMLGPGRISERKSKDFNATDASPDNSCSARVRSGLFTTTEKVVQFRIERDTKGPAELAAPDARLFSGDSVGSVSKYVAWALLPQGCPKGLRAEVHSSELGLDEERVRLAVSFANAAARENGCAERKLPTPTSLSARGAETDPDWNDVCGLPGFAPAKDPGAERRYSQQVTTAADPIWSCVITRNAVGSVPQAFTITTEPRTTAVTQDASHPSQYGRARRISGKYVEYVTTCQGKDTFFSLSGGFESDPYDYLFPDRDDLVRQFLTAGGKAIGCEPIL
ncbi:hypothetical protein [Kitasatospora sp. NPDC058046]|uniref:hypothetical protein n=1 Tax=Kitasatospora sp. NPDC058046 TaxID=3346312 RepID=UPI0036DD3E26